MTKHSSKHCNCHDHRKSRCHDKKKCRVFDYTDFRIEDFEYQTPDGFFWPTPTNWVLPPFFSFFLSPENIEKLNQEYKDGAVRHEDGVLILSNATMTDELVNGPNGPQPLKQFPGPAVQLHKNIGVRSNEKVRWDVCFSATSNFSNQAAIDQYGAENIVGGDPSLDMRMINPGLVMFAQASTKDEEGIVTSSVTLSCCFFLAKNAIWAVMDGFGLPFGSHAQWNHCVKVLETDTSKPNKYGMEYDRKNGRFNWYLNGCLVRSQGNLGLVPQAKNGDLLNLVDGPQSIVDPTNTSFSINGGNVTFISTQIVGKPGSNLAVPTFNPEAEARTYSSKIKVIETRRC